MPDHRGYINVSFFEHKMGVETKMQYILSGQTSLLQVTINPDDFYLFKVHNRSIRKRCEICSELTIKTSERRQWHRSAVFIVNFEHILHLSLFTLNKKILAGNTIEQSPCTLFWCLSLLLTLNKYFLCNLKFHSNSFLLSFTSPDL